MIQDHPAILVAGVIAPARALGLRTTAEGVERSSQLAVLRELGCDTAQGYLISRPLPPNQLDSVLREKHSYRDRQSTVRPPVPVHAAFTPHP